MRYPAYPRTKSSGIEWLGELPDQWKFIPLKYVTSFVNGMAFKPDEWSHEGVPIIRIENLNGSDSFNGYEGEVQPRYHVKKGELLFGWSGNRGTSFGPFDWPREGLHYLNQHIFRLADYGCDKRWFFWTLKALTKTIEDAAQGIIGMVHITKGELGALKIPLIPIQEQQQIAAFLDRKTGQIDALIAKKKQLMEKLKEKRLAVITQAVTKGLNPAAPLRDSGIPWLGQVPKHWEVGGFTKFVEHRADYRGKTPEKVREGVFLVTARNIKAGGIDYDLSQEFVSEDEYADIMSRGLPKIGDLLFTTEAPLGEVANIDREDIALAQRVIKFRGEPLKLNNYFAKYWMMSAPFQGHLMTLATGSTAVGIKASKLFALRCVVPPLDEQERIVHFLNVKLIEFTAMESKVLQAIDRLTEYRTALITAATTGKIDVRGIAIPSQA